jgi:hypothetical protein
LLGSVFWTLSLSLMLCLLILVCKPLLRAGRDGKEAAWGQCPTEEAVAGQSVCVSVCLFVVSPLSRHTECFASQLTSRVAAL